MNVSFSDKFDDSSRDATLAVFAFEGAPVSQSASAIDASVRRAIDRAAALEDFSGQSGRVLRVSLPEASKAANMLLVGLGAAQPADPLALEDAAGKAVSIASSLRAKRLEFDCRSLTSEEAARVAFAGLLSSYRFETYAKPTAGSEDEMVVDSVMVFTDALEGAQKSFERYEALASGILFARDLVSEPPNILFPAEFARRAEALSKLGVTVETLEETEMAKLGMGALLGVGEGSARESKLVVLQWRGGQADEPPIAFVGKGVCFDSGGVTLKAGRGMERMKYDMAGAAAVAGVIKVLAKRKAAVNAVGVLALVENMPDGAALRPSDVVRSMSGQTIEIISTDAEGRLVLADAVWYCQDRFRPRALIDIATLTGAIQTALGREYAGIFSNDDALADALIRASTLEGEDLWRMPLPPKHERQIESLIADIKNHDDTTVGGGSITGAQFIQRFVNGSTWAHLDISGRAWREDSTVSTIPDGATGYGVRLFNRFVRDTYEA